MSTEYKNDHVEVGEQFLAQRTDHSGEPTQFVVVRVDKDVVLRSKGIGDVIVDVERFLTKSVSQKGRLRFTPLI